MTEEKFNKIYAEHRLKLLSYVSGIIRDFEAAQEIVQETFARLLKQPDGKIVGDPLPWLFVVSRNLGIKHLEKSKRIDFVADYEASTIGTGCADDLMSSDDPFDNLCRKEESAELANTTQHTLKPRQKELLLLRYVSGMSYREIAEKMGFSEGNVGFMLHDSKRRLKKAYRSKLKKNKK